MIKGLFLMVISISRIDLSPLADKVEKETLICIIIVLLIILIGILTYEIRKTPRCKNPFNIIRFFRNVKLELILEKDRFLRPQILTITIRNIGKKEADIDAPVLEFRKIWTKRRFRLTGVNGYMNYPMYIDAGNRHQLRIETAQFHQYDRSIKSFYWARVIVSDVDGRKWKSNKVKLRKSLVT